MLSIGPDRVQQSLRTALGMGADRAIQIWDDGLAHADSLAIAKTIAAVAKAESCDLVLMGLMSDDTNFAVTGPMLAELLGVPHATGIVSAKLDGGQVEVERELEGGALEVVKLPLPCLLTVQTGMNEVRYASLKGIMQAKKKPLDKKSLGDVGLVRGRGRGEGEDREDLLAAEGQGRGDPVGLEGRDRDEVRRQGQGAGTSLMAKTLIVGEIQKGSPARVHARAGRDRAQARRRGHVARDRQRHRRRRRGPGEEGRRPRARSPTTRRSRTTPRTVTRARSGARSTPRSPTWC